jgi:hypothetical protein
MNRENVLNLRSFWQIQIVGWCCFYLFDLLESIHNFLTQRVSIKEQTVPIFFMFLGSCALRPFCRRLLRQSQSWIAFELKAAAAAMVTSIPVACAACLILESFEHVPWHALVTVWAWSFFMLFMWCSLYFSIKQWQQSSMEKERLLRAESEAQRGAPACTSLSAESTLPIQFAQCRLHSRSGWKWACGHADAGADRRSSTHKPGFRSHGRGDAFSGTGLYRRVPGDRAQGWGSG